MSSYTNVFINLIQVYHHVVCLQAKTIWVNPTLDKTKSSVKDH